MEGGRKIYTREDLRVMHFTGRSTSHGYGRDKTTTYRSGVQTKAGDLEESEWLKEAEALVARENGETVLDAFIKKTSSLAWLHNDKERRRYALELYMTKASGNQITTAKKSTQERGR